MSAAARPGSTLLVDVGSTVVKVCTRTGDRFSAVERLPRCADQLPGEQVRALVEQRQRGGDVAAVRICSSANGGLRVGVLGLSHRHSVAAAAGAATGAGGNVLYRRSLHEAATGPCAPEVDVLVLVGGVDGADHRWLAAALGAARLAAHPHRVLVWAGAGDAALPAPLAGAVRAGNVLDPRLRPRPDQLAAVLRELHVHDLVDRRGLRPLAGIAQAPIWPTPAVVALAAERMALRVGPLSPTAPFLVVDVGGATTDVLSCAELGTADGVRRGAPGAGAGSIVRQVFTDLGVVTSRTALLHRLAGDPELLDLVRAVAPQRPRELHAAVAEGDPDALRPPVGFLSCLFLALRRVAVAGAEPARARAVVVTGGAWAGAGPADIRRVVAAACGRDAAPVAVLLDHAYLTWAHGLAQVPGRGAGPTPPVSPR